MICINRRRHEHFWVPLWIPTVEHANSVRKWVVEAMKGRGMDKSNWWPWDLVAGGVLTAGLVYGVYRIGRNSVFCVRDRSGQTPGAGSELDSSRMKDCIALALSGGTHGTHMDVRPQVLHPTDSVTV
ncbi:hypothetical protein BaRGS_00008017 [Batillaria attramentaria]|uniref:Uncharacterized protein n=1 Tax=Batillaria attramentaria TaxID=370345 RepID=A0ABD0LNI5_9CAEN